MQGRREFEDRLRGALEQARRDGTLVAVVVGELMGLLVVSSRFGLSSASEVLREAGTRIESIVHGYADFVARVGEAEFAILLAGISDKTDAERLMARVAEAFEEPFVLDGEPAQLALAMGVNLGPSRRTTDGDLLWRAAEESTYARSAGLSRLLAGVRGSATNLDEVAQVFVDEGRAQFGLEGLRFEIGERSWSAPAVLPDRPCDVELPLRAEGRVIGRCRWWGPVPADDAAVTGVQVLLDHVGAMLDRASAIDATDRRARTDSLTGLLNREGLAREMGDVDGAYAVAVIDLDHFKRVNDEHGHDVGDLVLADLAALLKRGRTGDLVARWGGEEIVLVMPATTVDGAVARLQRLLAEAQSFVRVAEVGPITFSAGVTTGRPGEAFADAVRRADEAMYRAKRAGRARIEVG